VERTNSARTYPFEHNFSLESTSHLLVDTLVRSPLVIGIDTINTRYSEFSVSFFVRHFLGASEMSNEIPVRHLSNIDIEIECPARLRAVVVATVAAAAGRFVCVTVTSWTDEDDDKVDAASPPQLRSSSLLSSSSVLMLRCWFFSLRQTITILSTKKGPNSTFAAANKQSKGYSGNKRQ
jgi:hypothetical protein